MRQVNLPDGRTFQFIYDARNRLLSVTDNLGQVETREYDEYGNLVESSVRSADASNALIATMTYDSRNRLQESRMPHDNGLDSITRLVLDGESNLTDLTDPNTNPDGWVFDAVDRAETHTDPLSGETAFDYDTNDRITRVDGPTGIVTEYTYDLIGRVLTEVSPDRGTQTYQYDRANNMVAMTDGRGVQSTFAYDRLERLASKSFPGSPDENVTYGYDTCELGIGRLCSVQDESGASTYAYDVWGNVVNREFTEVSGTVFNTAFTYDDGNRVASMTYPSGRVVSMSRDGQRRVSEIQSVVNGQPQSIISDITYRGDDRMLTCTYGNGLEDTRTYDLQGRLRSQLLTGTGGSVVDTRTYGYDRNSNLLSIQTNFENNNYIYDPKDRVQTDVIDAINDTLYEYDLNDNRLTSSLTSNGAESGSDNYVFNSGTNQVNYLESIREETIADVTQIERRMVYNDVGRLFQLYESGELAAEYIYNEAGQRIRKTLFAGGAESATTIFHYDLNGLLISETDRNGNLIRDYIWSEAGHPVAQVDAGAGAENLTYLHQDHLMTNRLGTDASQQVVWRWEGEAFGSTLAIESAGVSVNLRFPGQYYDGETGWFYNWNRYYDPQTGRYITSDPIGLDGGLNTYGYANQNPIYYYDPTGENPWGAAFGFGLEMYNNYSEYGWNFECYAWLEIGASTVVGFFAPGLLAVGSKAGKTGVNTYKRIKRANRYKKQRSKRKQYNKIKKDFRGLRDIVLTQGLWQFGKEGFKAVNDIESSDSCDEKCQ